ncbi:MAG: hypothetical protein UW18_C0003G0159 [Microgenomates group bacterium GW2011_GWF1_44_10]|nr:MAG: hypothetical protein UW18_C0003G0159 [Microgenomates group bacterium GW2011_GWF1_44_10]
MQKQVQSLMGLLLLLLLAGTVRLVPIFPTYFPFQYDHAKDALAMHWMIQEKNPVLTGAITSIDGVFNGPAYYYLASPVFVLLRWHPIAGPIFVSIVVFFLIWYAWKTRFRFEAVLFATSAGIIGSQQSAWTPYMTPLLVFPLLILLTKSQKITVIKSVAIGILSGLLFHTQSAFGVPFFVSLIFVAILFFRKSMNIKAVIGFLSSFASTWIPFFLFELKHGWIQTQNILKFIATYNESAKVLSQNNQSITGRILEVGSFAFEKIGASISPLHQHWILLGIVFFSFSFVVSIIKRDRILLLLQTLLIGMVLIYLVFPCKSYYLIGAMPISIFIFARSIRIVCRKCIFFISTILIFLSLIQVPFSYITYRQMSEQSTALLDSKLKAAQFIYEYAHNTPFDSIHFVPEQYDYTYQYLYEYLAENGLQMPSTYTYNWNDRAYNPWKKEEIKMREELVFTIIEDITNPRIQAWTNEMQQNTRIIGRYQISDSIMVVVSAHETQ